MRVALSSADFNKVGGAERVAVEAANWLAVAGHEVTVYGARIDRTVVFPVFNSDYAAANSRLARIVDRAPDRLIGFAAINPARDARAKKYPAIP